MQSVGSDDLETALISDPFSDATMKMLLSKFTDAQKNKARTLLERNLSMEI